MFPTQKQTAKAYQPLFDLMKNDYDMLLTMSEMDEIVMAVNNAGKNLSELWRVKCDVKGCTLTASTQGIFYKDSGYWCLCPIHSQDARNDKPKPVMEKTAIRREEKRKKNKL